MLRGHSPLTTATITALRPSSNNPQAVLRALADNNTGSNIVHIVGRRDGNDPVALTLDIYVLEPQQQHHQSAIQAEEKLTTPPASARKCSWVALKQLRAELQLAIEGNSATASPQCDRCAQLATYLERCFERPAIFDRSWNGVMVLSASRLALFINTLLRLVCALPKEGNECSARVHKEATALLSSFLVPDLKKTE